MNRKAHPPHPAWMLLEAGSDLPPPRSWALFLDVDGTLIEIADAPDAVHVDDRIGGLLETLRRRLGGALALASGRSLDVLDGFFSPLELPAAGLHGLERRSADGAVHRTEGAGALDPARQELARFAAAHPGTLLEDKSATLALHYRRAAGAEAAAREVMERIRSSLGAAYRVQEGKMVLELKPHRPNKRTVVEDFMEEAPFCGRVPVFVGDDITDEEGFDAAQSAGGAAIVVGLDSESGRTSNARYGLSGVRELHRWLEAVHDGATERRSSAHDA